MRSIDWCLDVCPTDLVPSVQTLDRWRIFWLVEFLGSAMVRRSFFARVAGWYLRATARLLMRVQVRDAALRRRLTPDSPVGCKRTLLSNAWLAALARDNEIGRAHV